MASHYVQKGYFFMVMKIESCKTRLNSQIKKLEALISKKNGESKRLLKDLPWDEYLKADETVKLFIREAEEYIKELKLVLKIIDEEATQEDKVEFVDKGDTEKRARDFWCDTFEFDESFIEVCRCIELNMDKDCDKCETHITWVIGLVNLNTL